jgi:hypothetical protein
MKYKHSKEKQKEVLKKYAGGGGVGEKYLVDGDRVLNTKTNMYVDYDFETKERAEQFAKTKNDRIKKHGVDFAIGGAVGIKLNNLTIYDWLNDKHNFDESKKDYDDDKRYKSYFGNQMSQIKIGNTIIPKEMANSDLGYQLEERWKSLINYKGIISDKEEFLNALKLWKTDAIYLFNIEWGLNDKFSYSLSHITTWGDSTKNFLGTTKTEAKKIYDAIQNMKNWDELTYNVDSNKYANGGYAEKGVYVETLDEEIDLSEDGRVKAIKTQQGGNKSFGERREMHGASPEALAFAEGGSLGNHGLKQGDQIIKTMSGGVQKVKTKSGDIVYVNLANGYRGDVPPLPFDGGGRLKSALMRDRKNVNYSQDYEVRYSKDKSHRSGYTKPKMSRTQFEEESFEFFDGGGRTRERKYVNHSEDYEVRYSKDKPHRRGYGYAEGGFMADVYNNGGEVSFIEYKDTEIMYEPNYKKYYANDVEFDSLQEAKDFLDSGEIDPSIRDAYKKGLFATGGVTKNYINRKQLNTITVKKGDQKLTYKVSDVYNGAYKLEDGGNLEKMAFYIPKRNVVKVQLRDGKDVKVANGYWIKKGAKPIHTSKYDDGGMTEKEFMQKEINSQKEIEKDKVFKKYRVNVYENSYPFIDPLMTDNLLEAVNFAKKTIEEQRKYRASSKDLFSEISEFTPIEKRGNVRYPYYTIAYLSEEDLKSSKFDDGGQLEMEYSGGGALSNTSINYLSDLWFAVQQKDTDDYEMLSKKLDSLKVPFAIQNEVSADAETQRGRKALNIPEVHDRIKKIVEKNGKKFSGGGKIETKIQKKVDEINDLIKKAIDSDGDPLMVVDTNGTWEEPMQYKPIVYKNGRLYIEYFEPYSGKTEKEVVNKSNIDLDGYPTLLNIAKMYRKALKEKGISYAGGGKTTFKEKATAIAKNFEGKKVEPKYQKEYGKTYDKAEAKEVGNKIAGSQKAKYDSKMSGGGSTTKRGGAMVLAKQIRKDGESWQSALKRANQQLKK